MRRLLSAVLMLLAAPALACGPDSDCPVGGRSYRLYLPPAAAEGPVGALVFAHGYRGAAANEMRNMALRDLADTLGLALIALQADGRDWALAHAPQAPDRAAAAEAGYVAAVLADAAARAPIDPDRRVAAGFSAGGMLTWTLACEMAGSFAGFVPMSGTFWAPVPDRCPAPAGNLVHIHGTADGTVPLTGRAIGAARQGAVQAALDLYARHGGFGAAAPPRPAPGGMRCALARNAAGKVLGTCLFDGGHTFSAERLRFGIETVLAAP
jgi:polyhydroxybutyrate depolymerase